MARKIKVKLILELHEQGISMNEISNTRKISKHWPKVIGNVALGQAILGRVTAASYILSLEGQDLRSRHSSKP